MKFMTLLNKNMHSRWFSYSYKPWRAADSGLLFFTILYQLRLVQPWQEQFLPIEGLFCSPFSLRSVRAAVVLGQRDQELTVNDRIVIGGELGMISRIR